MRDQKIQINWNLCTEPHRKEIIHVASCPNSTLDYSAMKRLISKISTLTIKSKPTLHFMFSWLFREKYVTTNFWKICLYKTRTLISRKIFEVRVNFVKYHTVYRQLTLQNRGIGDKSRSLATLSSIHRALLICILKGFEISPVNKFRSGQ